MISLLVPTIPGRELWLKQLVDSVVQTCDRVDYEVLSERGGENWGQGINFAAKRASGDYLWLGSDDMELLPGWWEAATAACGAGYLPAPKVWNSDYSLQSCGEWGVEQPDGADTEFPRVPFCSREQWERVGPLLPIHFADVRFGTKARELGIPTRVCHGYQLVHHMVDVGRRDYAHEENLRLRTERLAYEADEPTGKAWDER